MPRNNTRAAKEAKLKAENITVGEAPSLRAPAQIVTKTLQDALIDGLEKPSVWMKDFLDVDLYPAQAEVADAFRDAIEGNFSAGNRVGKTFLSGAWLLWKAFYRHHPPFTDIVNRTQWNTYKAVNCSLTFDQSKLAWTYAYNFASSSKRFKPFLVDTVHSPFPKMTLRTRDEKGEWVPAEIHARSLAKNGLYLLGMSINHLQVDERAYVPKYETIRDEVLRMRLADTGGSIWQISTPNGRNGFYTDYQKGRKGDPRYVSRTLTTWDNPFVSRAYLEEQKRVMIPEFYAQNVMGDFISLSDFFRLEALLALYDFREKEEDYTMPVEPVKGAVYVMGADLGAQRDPTEVFVWRVDVQPIRMVFAQQLRNASWQASRGFIRQVYERYRPVKTAIDNTGAGAPIVQELMAEDELEGVIPFVFSATSKPFILTQLQDAIQQRRFIFPFGPDTQELVQQLSFYRLDDKNITQDKVMALALVNHAYEEWSKRYQMRTTIYDDLAIIDVKRGGEDLRGTDIEGPGSIFRLDEETGLFLPDGFYDEGDGYGFFD